MFPMFISWVIFLFKGIELCAQSTVQTPWNPPGSQGGVSDPPPPTDPPPGCLWGDNRGVQGHLYNTTARRKRVVYREDEDENAS